MTVGSGGVNESKKCTKLAMVKGGKKKTGVTFPEVKELREDSLQKCAGRKQAGRGRSWEKPASN